MDTQPPINPFRSQDIALAQQIVGDAQRLIEFFGKCGNCGANVHNEIAQAQAQLKLAQGIIDNFAQAEDGTGTP